MVNREKAVEELAARCEAQPGSVVRDLLADLRARPDELVAVLLGDALRVELVLRGWTEHETWLVFTPMGNVAVVADRAALGCDDRPHVLFRGTPEDVLRVVLGVTSQADAVAAGVFIPLVPVARFGRLLDLARRSLLARLDG